ncbi:MAG: hypothetical protein H7Y38_17965 [Armatimonadetes bacterium]|nr:hypothetical protein [Armatimonadota bacterium]
MLAAFLAGAAFVGGRVWREVAAPSATPPATRVAQAGVLPSRQSVARSSGKSAETSAAKPRFGVAATFTQVQSLVQSEYVDPLPSDESLSHGAAQALLAALEDEQSRFLLPSERAVMEREKAGNFAGIGAVTTVRGEKTVAGFTELHLLIVAPLPGSPAQKAGLRTGDRVTHFDGKYILPANPYLLPSKLPAPKNATDEDGLGRGIGLLVAERTLRQQTTGTHVLTVARRGTKQPFTVTVGNAATTAPPLRVSRVGAATVLTMGAFTKTTLGALEAALRAAPPHGSVVLDLRQNAGVGSLDVARMVAARLAPGSVFALEIGAKGKRVALPMPSPEKGEAVARRKIAVLTDGGTAGLAEAVAAYLVDNGASIVGTGRTWGDGRSTTLYPLADGSGYTLTTGRLIGSGGTGWDKRGLAPRLLLPAGLSEAETLARATRAATVGEAMMAKTTKGATR